MRDGTAELGRDAAELVRTLASATTATRRVGVAGALSTYSTFGFEIVRLAETGAARIAVTYALVSVVLGVVVASLAGLLARAMT